MSVYGSCLQAVGWQGWRFQTRYVVSSTFSFFVPAAGHLSAVLALVGQRERGLHPHFMHCSSQKKRKYPNRIPFIRGPKPSNQTAYSVGGDDLSVLRVRNQGQCNSCYAFTAAAALEGSVWTQSDGAFSVYLSPQHLGDCENVISQSCNPGEGLVRTESVSVQVNMEPTCVSPSILRGPMPSYYIQDLEVLT